MCSTAGCVSTHSHSHTSYNRDIHTHTYRFIHSCIDVSSKTIKINSFLHCHAQRTPGHIYCIEQALSLSPSLPLPLRSVRFCSTRHSAHPVVSSVVLCCVVINYVAMDTYMYSSTCFHWLTTIIHRIHATLCMTKNLVSLLLLYT